jgi:hypothetical protein
MNWRKIFSKSEHIKDSFKNYKIPDSKGELPNRADFSGDKFPKSGDPAKVELNAWHSGNSTYKKDKGVENKSKIPSPIIEEKNRREFVGDKIMERKSGWRGNLMSLGEVTFRQKKDGDIEIDVSDTNKNTFEDKELEPLTGIKTESNWRSVLPFGCEKDVSITDGNTIYLKLMGVTGIPNQNR